MSLPCKILLYFHTIRFLKWTQIWHRLVFKVRHPKADLSPAPPVAGLTPEIPFPRMPKCYAGEARFCFLHEEEPFTSWNDSNRNKLWLYNLHYFDWLRQEDLTETDGNTWISRWIAENPAPRGNGWEPYPLSLRIVNWIKWHWSGHPLSPEARHSLAVQVRFLTKRLEFHLLANHLLANAKALVFAGSFFSGPEAEHWLVQGLDIYRKQLPEQFLADGGHFERSPMYHSILLEDLLDLKNIQAPLELEPLLKGMLHWLSVMTGPDGKLALFNDAAHGIALSPETLRDYGNALGFECAENSSPEDLPDSGYCRLSAGEWTALCDGGAIGPDYQPGHAHADTLSFELWHGRTPLLIDSGTGAYTDSAFRREQRGTAGHNTLTVDGRNSSEVWGAHRVARRAKILSRRFGGTDFCAVHDGFAAVLHRREWKLSPEEVSVTDSLQGRGRHHVDLFWHFPPESRVTLFGAEAVIETAGKQFRMGLSPAESHQITDGIYSPGFGIWQKTPVLRSRFHAELPFQIKTSIDLKKSE